MTERDLHVVPGVRGTDGGATLGLGDVREEGRGRPLSDRRVGLVDWLPEGAVALLVGE